jgi:microcystin-dependent protein
MVILSWMFICLQLTLQNQEYQQIVQKVVQVALHLLLQTSPNIHTHTHTYTGTGSRSATEAAAQAHGNVVIMSTALAAGAAAAKQIPSMSGKAGAMLGSLVLGGTAILTIMVLNNMSGDVGRSDSAKNLSLFLLLLTT